MNKIIAIAVILSLALTVSMVITPAFAAPPIKRPMDLYITTIEGGSPQTVDYSWAYDTASGEIIFNTMDTLLMFNGEQSTQYIPSVAYAWSIVPLNGTGWYSGATTLSIANLYFENHIPGTTYDPDAGLYKGNPGAKATYSYRYDFKINSSIYFQPPYSYQLTPQDVAYSFQRTMVQDRVSGPQWMIQEPLLDSNLGSDAAIADFTDEQQVHDLGMLIENSVQYNATDAWFNLLFPSSYAPFLQILTQTWAAIESQKWINNVAIAIEGRADWGGNWSDVEAGWTMDHTGWIDRNAPTISPLDDPTPLMYGSGPFQLTTLDYSNKFWAMVRYPGYFRGWPADFPVLSNAKPAGYVNTIEETWNFVWAVRKNMFLQGDCDYTALPSNQYLNEMYQSPTPPYGINKVPPNPPLTGIREVSPLPTLIVDACFFTMDINPATFYGSISEPGVFHASSIPSDFFGNADWGVHVRKGFAYAFDYATFLSQVFIGEATTPATAIIPGLAYYDASVTGYFNSTALATAEFNKVPGLMGTGFTLTLVYNTGNLERKVACELLATALHNINSKFTVTVTNVDWSPYLTAAVYQKMPCFIIGWQVDFPDPHDFALPFYHTGGAFAVWQAYSNATMDALIDKGILDNAPADRQADYTAIEKLAVADCPSFTLAQPIGRHFEKDWVNGYYYNAIYPGGYQYNRWKWYYVPIALYNVTTYPNQPNSTNLPADVNYDGKVDIKDVATVSKAYGSAYGPPMGARWVWRGDVNNDRKIDIKDVAYVSKQYGKNSPVWNPGFSLSISPITAIYNMTVATPITFTATPAGTYTGPLTYRFYDNSTGGALTLKQTGASNTYSFTPSDTGLYQIYATATDSSLPNKVAQSQTAVVLTVFTVVINPYPGGYVNPHYGNPCVRDTYNGTGWTPLLFTSFTSGGHAPVTEEWYLNGALNGTGPTYNFIANVTGTYEVYLEVTDSNGIVTDSDTTEVYADYPITINPASAAFTAPGTQLYTVTISPAAAPPLTYSWRVYQPDGTLIVTTTTTSTFTFDTSASYYVGPGLYYVRVRITDIHDIRVSSAKSPLTIS